MKKFFINWTIGLIVVLPLLASGASRPPQAAPAKSAVQWRPTFQTAMQEAKRTHKPLLVYFHTVWCSPCKILDTKTFADASVIAASKKWISVKVDGDHAPDLDKKYKIDDNYPTIVFVRPDGTATRHVLGFQTPALLIKAMNAAYTKSR